MGGAICSREAQHNDVEPGDSPKSTLVTCKIGYMTTPFGCKQIELGKPVIVPGHDGPAAVCTPGDFYSGPRGVVRFDKIKNEACI
jgi:hypothetical protein